MAVVVSWLQVHAEPAGGRVVVLPVLLLVFALAAVAEEEAEEAVAAGRRVIPRGHGTGIGQGPPFRKRRLAGPPPP
jgi:hypothetical protein